MAPVFYWEDLMLLVPSLVAAVPSGLVSIGLYVLGALALYSIAQRRGIRKAWLAWVPVVDCWILGSLSDQYRYVAKGQVKNKRKWLLGLSIFNAIATVTLVIYAVVVIGKLMMGYDSGLVGAALSLASLLSALSFSGIAKAVFYFMALYDLYQSMDPNTSVLFLVLSILFRPTEPFFLFFTREKEEGMPPRRQDTVYEGPAGEHTEYKDYL